MNDYDIALRDFLTPMVNENRYMLLNKILGQRTRYLTVVLEDIYQSHNASAVLRTCDCFGIQDVHIIENRNRLVLNPDVELGAAQWLTLRRYNERANNTLGAMQKLKEMGYRIVAATPHKEDADVRNFDLSAGKIALMLGTEMKGLSDEAIKMADEFVAIPMMGFTESFNISVSAAVLLYELNTRLRSSGISWKIEPSEKELIRLQWLRNSVNNISWIEQGFKKRYAT